ncbi:MAG: hypothetical protein R6U32_03600 [Candidatus Woesearchaeota archaeon]
METGDNAVPEKLFSRYAFPCTEVILQKGKISQERFNELKAMAEKGVTPPKKILEETYTTAMEQMDRIAERRNTGRWDIEVIKEYFERGGHNDFIDSGGGEFGHAPESMKDMCRILEGEVEEINGGILKVRVKGRERMCRDIHNLGLKKGNRVIIHYGYVVGKI